MGVLLLATGNGSGKNRKVATWLACRFERGNASTYNHRNVETYHHIQRSPFYLLIYTIAAVNLALAWSFPGPAAVGYILVATAVAIAMMGAGFHHLAVSDEGDQLRIQFGPFPLFGTTIRYNEITAFDRDRTTLMEGWGIHKSFRGGWVWNIWGRDCVVIHHTGTTRVGTDDIEGLMNLLSSRTSLQIPVADSR